MRMAWLLKNTFPFGTWEWAFKNHSTVDSQTLGPHTCGVTTRLSTGKLSPHPEGVLGTLLLSSFLNQLSMGHMNALNIQPTQMCTMCTMPPDTWQRVNFRKQVSTGRGNHHITGHSVSPWNTSPQTTNYLNQLSSRETKPPDIWPTSSPQIANPRKRHNIQKFCPQNRTPTSNPKTGSPLNRFDTGKVGYTDT